MAGGEGRAREGGRAGRRGQLGEGERAPQMAVASARARATAAAESESSDERRTKERTAGGRGEGIATDSGVWQISAWKWYRWGGEGEV